MTCVMMNSKTVALVFGVVLACVRVTEATPSQNTCSTLSKQECGGTLNDCKWCECATVPSMCRSKMELEIGPLGINDICHPSLQLNGAPPSPPPMMDGVMFNQSFGSSMVLQRSPQAAVVYGMVAVNAQAVTITVAESTQAFASYTVHATITSGGNWQATLKPTAMGGDVTITAQCSGCTNSTPAVLNHVTFGDVWYCSGQSNMWLPLFHSFSRNYSVANISAGNLDNIRLMAGDSQQGTFHPWMTAKASIANSNETMGQYTLFGFSAACWYFAEELTFKMKASGKDVVPLGLIGTAIGGSMIEEWTLNTTTATCQDTAIGSFQQTLWDEKVVPYLAMTMGGFLWYQGENNMHGVHGNSINHTGYGCQMPAMISLWRKTWSSKSGTDPMAPFGLVALPGSGSEGGPNMGAFRWAQTGNYGYLPNELMPSTFLAQAYDLNDPWGDKTCYGYSCCKGGNKTQCSLSLQKRNLPVTACDEYCQILMDTQVFMGGIHPRDKRPVGVRLANAIYGKAYGDDSAIINGATIAGCSCSLNTITITMNSSLLGDEKIIVVPINITLTPMEVNTNMSLVCMEPALRCKVLPNGTRPEHCGSPAQEWYCPGGPGTDVVQDHSLSTQLRGTPPRNPYDNSWVKVPATTGSQANTVVLDTSAVNGTIVAVRYAWNGKEDCCLGNGVNIPCAIEQCPIMTQPSGLPANPFIALIKQGKCSCFAPQQCNA